MIEIGPGDASYEKHCKSHELKNQLLRLPGFLEDIKQGWYLFLRDLNSRSRRKRYHPCLKKNLPEKECSAYKTRKTQLRFAGFGRKENQLPPLF
jgi:hypothetical protein